jgi:hypothetical protein
VKVATAIGRYLASPNTSADATPCPAESFVGVTLAQTLAALFVDIMRLAYVNCGTSSRAANLPRYPEFVDVAEQHQGELQSHIQRFATDLDAHLHRCIVRAERGLSWGFTRLRRGPEMHVTWSDIRARMLDASDSIHDFCSVAAGHYYARYLSDTDKAVEEMLQLYKRPPASLSVDELFRLRLMIQSIVLERMDRSGPLAIHTVRDDVDQEVAVSYFVIDRRLLQYTSA